MNRHDQPPSWMEAEHRARSVRFNRAVIAVALAFFAGYGAALLVAAKFITNNQHNIP